ncbi:hypothetical protein HYR99_00905 [Candidatus Poribacteria bacterium]|nr:hypothetical protein [Candidatus Poribacteria bacterium]
MSPHTHQVKTAHSLSPPWERENGNAIFAPSPDANGRGENVSPFPCRVEDSRNGEGGRGVR